MNVYKIISKAIKDKLQDIDDVKEFLNQQISDNIVVEVPKNRDFGDFSTNVAMVLARPMGSNPRAIAEKILPYLESIDYVDHVSIAGPGFINMVLKEDFIFNAALQPINFDDIKKQIIDLDYGGYNIGKSLHIGHLRTTVVGDTFNRVAKFIGHKTKSYNHMGDWGRPMGLIIAWILEYGYPKTADDINNMYPASSARASTDEEWMNHAKEITVKLQDGNEEYRKVYDFFAPISLKQIDGILKRLNVLPFDENKGERLVAEYIPEVHQILKTKNLPIISEGAEIIPVKLDSDTAPMPPVMWRSSAGAQTYAAADLTAIYYRKKTDNPDEIIYFTDSRQNLHFLQIFRAAEMVGFTGFELHHIGFGAITGADGKPFKTRDGNVPSLIEMIDLVRDSVRGRVQESNKTLSDETIEMIALAALKFNDLIHNVKSDYIFDLDGVTSFEGRTGPYVLYTAVRMNSILKKAGFLEISKQQKLCPEEYAALFDILDFERSVLEVFDKQDTSILANYTYNLCQKINSFYHNCPILQDNISKDLRNHRLQIVKMAHNILLSAIDLMGLSIPDEM